MTLLQRVRCSLAAAAVFCTISVTAQTTCPPTPEKYRKMAFGDARFAVEESCRQTFTQNEQFFLAGIAQSLIARCKLPRDRGGRALMERFTKAAALSLELRKPQEPLDETLGSNSDGAAAFEAGRSMMGEIRCDGPEAALLARGIALYLKRTAHATRFVEGCVEVYAGRYGASDCRCIADTLRPLVTDVDQRFFDRALVKESIHRSPTVALKLMLSCGVTSY